MLGARAVFVFNHRSAELVGAVAPTADVLGEPAVGKDAATPFPAVGGRRGQLRNGALWDAPGVDDRHDRIAEYVRRSG